VQFDKFSNEHEALRHASFSLMSWIRSVQREGAIPVEVE